jgi:hypothetical protein
MTDSKAKCATYASGEVIRRSVAGMVEVVIECRSWSATWRGVIDLMILLILEGQELFEHRTTEESG